MPKTINSEFDWFPIWLEFAISILSKVTDSEKSLSVLSALLSNYYLLRFQTKNKNPKNFYKFD